MHLTSESKHLQQWQSSLNGMPKVTGTANSLQSWQALFLSDSNISSFKFLNQERPILKLPYLYVNSFLLDTFGYPATLRCG